MIEFVLEHADLARTTTQLADQLVAQRTPAGTTLLEAARSREETG